MAKFLPILFWAMAMINLAPGVSAVMPSKLSDLYGISPDNQDLLTLMQHRAILLACIGLALAFAAHRPELRWPALGLGFLSMGSFIIFVLARGQMSGPLGKIAWVDLVGLGLAVITAFILLKNRRVILCVIFLSMIKTARRCWT